MRCVCMPPLLWLNSLWWKRLLRQSRRGLSLFLLLNLSRWRCRRLLLLQWPRSRNQHLSQLLNQRRNLWPNLSLQLTRHRLPSRNLCLR